MDTAGAFAVRDAVEGALFECRISLLGDSGVGKTSLARSFVQLPWNDNLRTSIGMDILTRRIVNDDGVNVVYYVSDTAGQERFRAMLPSQVRNSDAAVIVYDVTCAKSFENVRKWLHFVMNNMSIHTPVMMVGNKADLYHQREVTFSEGLEVAERSNLLFVETSAKTGDRVVAVFKQLSTVLRDRRMNDLFRGEQRPLRELGMQLSNSADEYPSKKSCCL
ncbi:ras-related protein RABF1 [Aplysia californica]|uniref:Ras-related protein RABF1 n=1 Tax=Aplysia californica TaxID=6500 RepID=A0ABM0ZV23_APLCA|nr:ras-related protein RABF1 [Aplysia californica]